MKKVWFSRISAITFNLLFIVTLYAQNTVGLVSSIPSELEKGFNLIYPHNQPNVYLLNECGEIVHMWQDEEEFRPGNTAYIMENGNLYKTKRPAVPPQPTILGGGAGGIVELRDWDNNLLWSVEIMDSLNRAHHDIAPMPNGNVLVLIWERKDISEAVNNGRDTSTFSDPELWPEYILEFDPVLDSIVWEWHVWDHIIQEFDDTKQNFGIVADHPELIDINTDIDGIGGRGDWQHANSIDYNEDLDQILISTPYFNEIWIIDHSTTTEEAKGHTGGQSGRGGDLIYRWGNPRTYQGGEKADQTLFFQHDAHWNDDFLDGTNSNFGSIALFNNRVGGNYSTTNILTPTFDETSGMYVSENGLYLPDEFDRVIFHPDTFPMFSSGLSGVQFLKNDNVLITVGRRGYTFELNPSGDIVWEYINPLIDGSIVSQGQEIAINQNILFRLTRYPYDYAAFDNKDLSSKGYIELDAVPVPHCLIETDTEDEELIRKDVSVFPNPSRNFVRFKVSDENSEIQIFDLSGFNVFKGIINNGQEINITDWSEGLFFVFDNNMRFITKFTVIH